MPTYLWLVYVLRLAVGIQAIQANYAPVDEDRAIAYATAAAYHGFRLGIDPFELVAVARNESDFQPTLRGPDGKDCGLTQTRITISRYSCKQLRSSYWIAFAEAARELSEYRDSCVGRPDFDRCRINKYNSGVHYARTGVHGRYYLRIQCFAEAARQGIPVGRECRLVQSRKQIHRLLASRRPQPSVAALDSNPASKL
jgi:hypothetical protein